MGFPVLAADSQSLHALKFLDEFHKVEWKDRPIDLSRVTMNGPAGEKVEMKALEGKWLILNLWAMWCAPCVDELPRLDKLKNLMKDKRIDVLAVSIDRNATPEALAAFLTRHRAAGLLPLYDTDKKLQKILKPDVMPMTYVINPQGRVVAYLYGPADWSGGGARAFISVLERDGPGFIRLYAARDKAAVKP